MVRRSAQPNPFLWPAFLLSMFMLTSMACVLNSRDSTVITYTADGSEVLNSANNDYLVCTGECEARGMCGRSENETQYVIVNSFAPEGEVNEFSSLVPVNQAVTIVETRAENGVFISNGEQVPYRIDFHRVTYPQSNVPVWVMGWCVAGAPNLSQ